MKRREKQTKEERSWDIILWGIILVPIILFILDASNLASYLYPFIKNLTSKYDWLSFAGTYLGAIVSAIFLLLITIMDRRQNNRMIQQSQRPYLDINWTILKADFIEQNRNNLNRQLFFYSNWGFVDVYDNAEEYLTLEIKNTGASTAIIDVNKSNFELEYYPYKGTINGEEEREEKETRRINFDSIVKRKSVAAGESMFIVCNSIEIYDIRKRAVESSTNIKSTEIYYKDLFNYQYEDICDFKNGKCIPKKDNELIKEK